MMPLLTYPKLYSIYQGPCVLGGRLGLVVYPEPPEPKGPSTRDKSFVKGLEIQLLVMVICSPSC